MFPSPPSPLPLLTFFSSQFYLWRLKLIRFMSPIIDAVPYLHIYKTIQKYKHIRQQSGSHTLSQHHLFLPHPTSSSLDMLFYQVLSFLSFLLSNANGTWENTDGLISFSVYCQGYVQSLHIIMFCTRNARH